MSRSLSAARLAAAIRQAAEAVELGTLSSRVAKLLVSSRSVRLWPRIAAAMQRQALAERGLSPLTVTAAAVLEPAAAVALGRHLSHATFKVDGRLIGGAVVRHGDTQIDRSVRGRLAELRRRLSPNQ